MKAIDFQNSFIKLTTILGITGIGALFSLPTLAQPYSKINFFKTAVSEQANDAAPISESKQLFAQSTTGGNSSPSRSSTGGSFSAPTEHSNSSSENLSGILQSQDVNPPAEAPSGSLRYLDYSTAVQPSQY